MKRNSKLHSKRRDTAQLLLDEWRGRGLSPEIEHTSVERGGIIVPFQRLWLRVGAPVAASPDIAMPSSRDWTRAKACKVEIVALLQESGKPATRRPLGGRRGGRR